MNAAPVFSRAVDLVIVGGGIAGLWLANVARQRGYEVLVLEAEQLGGQQTLASQGMIHGGLKYALSGKLSGASEAIADMPRRWRACLDGSGEIDLSALRTLSDHYYLFGQDSTLGRLRGFFASKALRGRIEKLHPDEYPQAFRQPGFNGVVYQLNDLVLDTQALLLALQANLDGRLYRQKLEPEHIRTDQDRVELHFQGGVISAGQLIFCAGAGNQALLEGLQITKPRMQLRGLQQVVVRHDYPHPLYGHCLTGIRRAEPRLTITSHRDGDHWLWYIGGQLASAGVNMSEAELVTHARAELEVCVPWIPWRNAQFSTLRVDRAEPEHSGGQRPDEAFVARAGPHLVCWPTKLALAPDLADKVLPLLAPPAQSIPQEPQEPQEPVDLPLPAVNVGRPPWEA
jgi:hypothetical protein